MEQEPAPDLRKEAGRAVVAGLKQAGINFVAALASSGFGYLVLDLMHDPDFTYVPVANEHDAIAICAGASVAGKKTAFIAQNSGLILATYALMDSIHWFGGFPILLVVDHRGGFGDPAGYIYHGYGVQQPKLLENLHILFNVISMADFANISTQIVRAQRSAEANGSPAALLLSREEI